MNKLFFENIEDPDWAWLDDVPEIEMGDDFNEEDFCFDLDELTWYESEKCKIYFNENGDKITFNYGYDDFIYTFVDGEDDWVFNVLMTYDGGYESSDGENYYDSDEMNYIGDWLSDQDIIKFEELLNKPLVINLLKDKLKGFSPNQTRLNLGYPYDDHTRNTRLQILSEIYQKYIKHGKIDVKHYIEEQIFADLEYLCNLIYNGIDDWDDFESECLYDLSYYLEINRWISVNSTYSQMLEDNNMSIDYGGGGYRSENKVKLTIPYPFDGEYNITDIKNKITNLLYYGWSDVFYEEYSHEGAGDAINKAFENLIEVLSETIEGLEEESEGS